MRKFSLFMLMAVGLLISGNSWAYSGTGTEGDPYLVSTATDFETVLALGGNIKLNGSISVAKSAAIQFYPKDVTIDLNGQTIDFTGDNKTYLLFYNKDITNPYTLTIKNTSGSEGVIKGKSSNGVVYVGTYGALKITDNVKIETTATYAIKHYGTSLFIDENVNVLGEISCNGATVLTYKSTKVANPKITLNSSSGSKTFVFDNYVDLTNATLSLTGQGTINNYHSVSLNKALGSYTLTIDNKENTSTCAFGSSFTATKLALIGSGFSIVGGQFTCGDGDCNLNGLTGLTVSGGVFDMAFYNAMMAKCPSCIQSGYLAIEDWIGDRVGMKIITTAEEQNYYTAKIGATTYSTLAHAVAKAQAGDKIEMLKTEALSSYVTIDKDLTIDLKGKTITSSAIYALYISGTGTISLTIEDSENDGLIECTSTSSSGSAIYLNNKDANLMANGGTLSANKYAIYVNKGNTIKIGEKAQLHSNTTDDVYVYYYCGNIITDPKAEEIVVDFKLSNTSSSYCFISAANLESFQPYLTKKGYFAINRQENHKTYGDVYQVYNSSASPITVGGLGYSSLTDALQASSAEYPATLQQNVSLTSATWSDVDYYLDLNGKTFTITQYAGITLDGNAKLTVLDNSVGKTGKIVYSPTTTAKASPFVVRDAAQLTIKGGTIESPEANAIEMPGEGTGRVVTISDGATIIAGVFCIANNGSNTEMNSTINIESGAQLTSTTTAAIYHPGGGYLNISGDNTLIQGVETGVEIRAGELNMTGGTVACTGTTISCEPNGSGTTTKGAGISVAQHTTTQPIIVNISGGVVSGPFALVQLNPQGNDEENYLKMKVNVTGGKFITTKSEGGSLLDGDGKFGTVTYDANAMLLSQNRRILVSGGYYKNYDPAPFVMPGYTSVLLEKIDSKTPEDAAAFAEGYIYKVTKITEAGSTDVSNNSGDWHNDASNVWTSTKEPDKLTQVTINGQEIVVSTPATAYGIAISGTQAGNTKLTITETGRLMVDMGGITGTTPITFDVQNGGQMAIAPAATLETESQPEATVTLVADWAHRKADADSKADNELLATDLYWQHIATPLSDGNQPTPSQFGVSYVNTWNLVNGWMSAGWEDVVTPFVGYQISSVKKSNEEKITLTFKGKLVGNHVDPMKFSRIGFSFFGNSYLAPIDIRELLTCLETRDVVDPTILLYNSKDGIYAPINRASFYIPGTIAEIKPMQGFFVFAESAANVDFDYTKAVWNSFCAKAQSGVVVPTAPKMEENPFSAIACIDIKAEDGAADRVMLFEGDELSAAEDKGYDAHKMITSGMNIYAKGSYADLAILATDNLLGSELILKTDANTNYTMSFANIKGEYALYDALTGNTINMTEGATYEFQAQAEATITDRFFVVEAAKAPTKMANIGAQAGSCKFMKQGIMFIERNNKVYNAQGQIVK